MRATGAAPTVAPMSLAVLRALAPTDGGFEAPVVALGRAGAHLEVGLAGGRLRLVSARHQPRLFGDEPDEQELVGTLLRIDEDELEKIGRRRTFIAVFADGSERGRSYLCDAARAIR